MQTFRMVTGITGNVYVVFAFNWWN